MKKYCIMLLALVLTCSVLTGCRGRNKPMETTLPTTAPTTQATTMPTTPTTQATQPRETMDRGNGPAGDSNGSGTNNGTVGGNGSVNGNTGAGEAATGEARSVNPMPRN